MENGLGALVSLPYIAVGDLGLGVLCGGLFREIHFTLG